ncbi:ABC transporter substrate-binding protein [Halarsenatibacter silvermanii]|uniref:Iron complex transport system substrate-binding protein n=1 Tax=Halarsenatibacter silvermanii TaxID=321763 RepID=A0A1G9SUJ1_9FIRM|nr:ABC transporter substrate-binding protein [Halarsenatibacter silvermanii]SDM39118.1 iron complex transport system substrate-binding protein [Halarsenatibacter silvermanii]
MVTSIPLFNNFYHRFMKNFLLISLAVVFILAAGAFINPQSARVSGEVLEIEDRGGRIVEVPHEPEEVIAVGSGAPRNVLYFTGVENIIGVEEGEVGSDDELYRDYQLVYEELREKPQIGPNHGGDSELIARQDPDLIIHSGDVQDAEDLQDRTEIPVVYLDFGDLHKYRDVLFDDWRILGEIFGEEDRAEELIDFTEEIISDLESRGQEVTEEKRPEVFIGGMGHRGAHGLTSVRVPFPPLEFLDADHVAERELDFDTVTQANVDREQLMLWDPDYIFMDSSNLNLVYDDMDRHDEFAALKAVQKERTHTLLPYSSYHRQFSNILANGYYIGSVIYPEAFEDVDPVDRAEEIMEVFLGEPVFEEQQEFFPSFEQINLLEK